VTILGKPVSFFATAKPEESRYFFETILKLQCLSDDPFALLFDLGVTSLRIQKVEAVMKVNYTVLGWEVDDIQTSVSELTKRGVQFERYAQLPQNDLGVWDSPGGASVAWFNDPDGNTLSLTEL